jgi:flagellar biosynthetic protein FlhB
VAEEAAGERTEEATQRKRQQARDRGQVPRSRDFSAAVIVFATVLFLRYGGPWMATEVMNVTGSLLADATRLPLPEAQEMVRRSPHWVLLYVRVMAPLLIVTFAVALLAGFGQAGFVWSSEALEIKLDKLNPIAGFKRLLNLRAFMTLVMSLGKVALVLAVATVFFRSEFYAIKAMSELGAGQVAIHMVQAGLDLMLRLAAVLLVLAIFDLWYQRYQWEQDLRMTKQEVKEEMRDTEGDPHIRNRRRQVQRQLAQQRMMAEVPEADVVVRNPTHYAVALRYEPEKDPAPWVVAKGMNKLALRIVKVAIEGRVPVKYQPDLARKLYRLEVGEAIPEELFQAVAEVLAWVVNTGRGREDLAENLARV